MNSFFQCCKNTASFLIVYDVAGQHETYRVCKECFIHNFFRHFIISKESIDEVV